MQLYGNTPPCLTDDELAQIVLGQVDEVQFPRLQAHLEACPSCLTRLEHCPATDSLVVALQDAPSSTAAFHSLATPVRELIHRLQAVSPAAKRPPASSDEDSNRLQSGSLPTLIQNAVQVTADTSLETWLAGKTRPESRYLIEQEIARGGMGAVVRAVDCHIRREVAIKYMLDETDHGKQARFVEEAQITGQLEHPNIVPIHDLGLDAQKRLFFAMKMVNGRSLAEILTALRKEPHTAERTWPLNRLLNILVNVCHALSYAHSRGVIHRDLKPANIMVGDFGEVYVMDWGLAKVIGPGQATENPAVPPPALPQEKSSSESHAPGSRAPQLSMNRELKGEATQDGMVIGTVSYMPPEQARGDIHALDQRSDLYALGAILYEFLTLHTPVEKEGGQLAILMRVIEGQIQPPAERVPQRAKQGKIPQELAAIAMKALSLRPSDRYPNCAALRRDIELYQEGRSVSAKHDSAVELLRKLIKRNKGVGIAIGTAAVILLTFAAVFLKLNRDARLVAEKHERQANQQRGIAVEQKQLAEDQKKRAELAQAETEKTYTEFQREQNAKELVIRQSIPAMIRAGRQQANEGRVVEANQQVTLAMTYAPEDPDVRLLKGQLLLSEQRFDDCRREFTTVLQHRPADEAASALLAQLGETDSPDTVRLFALAELLKQQQLTGLAIPLLKVVQLDAAKKKPLVDLYNQQIETNWPGLGGKVKLEQDGRITLSFLGEKRISDLTPLRGMQLDELNLDRCHLVRDLRPLTGMPLKLLYLSYCPLIEDIEPLRAMPLTNLSLFGVPNVRDFSPLKGMALTALNVSGNRHLASIEVLRGMPLTGLTLNGAISDLEPLTGMRLQSLSMSYCKFVTDLTPLQGMPLKHLNAEACSVKDLSPLAGMPLETLNISGTFADLEPLRGMRLRDAKITSGKVMNLLPLQGMPLERLDFAFTSVSDLEPLRGMELQFVRLAPEYIRAGMEVLRDMKSLTTISRQKPAHAYDFTPAEFWQRYDAGEFDK